MTKYRKIARPMGSIVISVPDAEAWAAFGRALVSRDHLEDRLVADRAFRRAVELAPDRTDYRIDLADLYARQGFLTLARRQLMAALARGGRAMPGWVSRWNNPRTRGERKSGAAQ